MSAAERRRNEARTQALFREVNERILEVLDAMGPDGRAAFVCECGRPDCAETVTMSQSRYREIHSHPLHFIVIPGHESHEAESVVERTRLWLVVETIGAAADEAARRR